MLTTNDLVWLAVFCYFLVVIALLAVGTSYVAALGLPLLCIGFSLLIVLVTD